MVSPTSDPSSLVLSYLTLRRAVGIVGLALPIVLWIGALVIFNTSLQDTISHYYHTGMRSVFVGALATIGAFLWSYKGYDWIDDRAGDVAGLCAIGVALFPTAPSCPTEPLVDGALPPCDIPRICEIVGYFHAGFAALFFLILAFISLCLFTKSDPDEEITPTKEKRNRVYRIAGGTILAMIGLILLNYLFSWNLGSILGFPLVFLFESIAVMAFGFSWLIKGETLFVDPS